MILTQPIPQQQISQQQKYTSFILCKTSNRQTAQKWPFYILSHNNQLLMNTEQKGEQNKYQSKKGMEKEGVKEELEQFQYQYNISVDAFCCRLGHGSRYVLAEAGWIMEGLGAYDRQYLRDFRIALFDLLSYGKDLRFYYYINHNNLAITNKTQQNTNIQGIFARIYPLFLIGNKCIVFSTNSTQLHNPNQLFLFSNFRDKVHFKNINNSIPIQIFNNKFNTNKNINQSGALSLDQQHGQDKAKFRKIYFDNFSYFNFNSDYALLSDQHFLNCFVRGKKDIASYIKIGSNYWFFIDDFVYQALSIFNIEPKL